MQLSKVDLPQPEAPKRTKNSPFSIVKLRSLSTLTSPKFSERFLISMLFIFFNYPFFSL